MRRRRGRRGGRRGGRDPLAQTFHIIDETGVFVTKIDLFFQQKDDQFPVKFQINETESGHPAATVVPFSEVFKNPDEVFISDDGYCTNHF